MYLGHGFILTLPCGEAGVGQRRLRGLLDSEPAPGEGGALGGPCCGAAGRQGPGRGEPLRPQQLAPVSQEKACGANSLPPPPPC